MGNDYAPPRRQQSYAEAAAASPRRCSYSSAEHPERHEQQSEVYHSENEEFETPVVADSQCIDTEVADSEPPPPPPVKRPTHLNSMDWAGGLQFVLLVKGNGAGGVGIGRGREEVELVEVVPAVRHEQRGVGISTVLL
ncbi:hypothetical protein ACOMHN_030765 [Nucella lapillus]